MIITRFAPSPTGFLHIGGVRTALFNWLFARHYGGQFLLRIEDTDRVRSTQEAIEAIFQSLRWLGIHWDQEPVFQFSRMERHKEVVQLLLNKGHAYYSSDPHQPDKPPAVRFKIPKEGATSFNDHVMGTITVAHDQMEDWVLLRSDGTPTYNLAVVVDDHDMGITHVIRGNDHVSNTPKQIQIYAALEWNIPEFSHVPMILGQDGTKLSKRHGALNTMAYKEMGYLPEALKNYLTRLGWSHGDDEFFSMEQAIAWFSLESIGKSPSQFDMQKLDHINSLHLRHMPADDLLAEILPFENKDQYFESARALIPEIAQRAKTLCEARQMLSFLFLERPIAYETELDVENVPLKEVLNNLAQQEEWTISYLEKVMHESGVALKKLAPHLRLALTGKKASLPIFAVMQALGKKQSLLRIEDYIQTRYS